MIIIVVVIIKLNNNKNEPHEYMHSHGFYVGKSYTVDYIFLDNNHTLIRGILTCLCLGGSAIFLVLTSLAAHTHSTLHLMSTICVCAFHGLSSGCTLLNPLDLAPPSYWGVLFSAMETVGGMAGGHYIDGS